MTFEEILDQAIAMLQRRGRLTYGALKRQFHLDDDYLEDLKAELITGQRLAVDEDGAVLVWIGGTEVPPPTTPREVQSIPPGPPPPLEAERRQLTVMFCDLVESTRLAGQLDPEDLREVVRAYQATCAEVIQRFDGHIAQYLGDGLLVYFGYPQAHEDDAQRAVRAALGSLEALGGLNTRLERDQGIRLAVRLGMHTGLVVVGAMGGAGRQEQLALGEVPNIAARLQGLAAPNTALISADTYRLIQGYFACRALGDHALRGVAQPIAVYQVLQESGTQSRLDVAQTRGLTPLVGREAEVTVLLDHWEHAKQGHGHAVLLRGEGGMGKSRLVHVVKERIARDPHTRWEWRSSPYYQHTALYPLTEFLQRAVHWQQHATAEARLDTLEQVLCQFRLPLEESMPLFAPLLSLAVPVHRYPPLPLSPQRQRQKTLDSLVAMLLDLAAHQPVLFILEDLHWTDPTTLEWLAMLLEHIPTAPIYILWTCRPEFQPAWPQRSALTEVTVPRLSRDQIAQMATHVAGGKTLPAALIAHLVDKTDGVPLYCEEMTKGILEAGHLQETDAHYEVVGTLPALAIPATLHDALMARLDRLLTAKGIAQLGATIGRQFSYALLRHVAQVEEDTLHRELRRLVGAELLSQDGLPPRATYTFKHALIQDTAYHSLLKSTRQQYHQRIAQVLESQFPETAATHPELLAHHSTEAGRTAQAIGYWQQAGQRALERAAYREAVQHLTQGLALLGTLPETPARAQQELTLQLALGTALQATQGLAAPAVEAPFARARALCAQVGDTPQVVPVLRGLSRFYANRGELSTARELGEQLLRLAQRAALPAHRLAAYDILGNAYYHLGDYAAARTYCEQGIALTELAAQQGQELHSHAAPAITCRTFAARALWCLGFPAQALRRSQDALALAQALGQSQGLGLAHHFAALLHLCRREVPLVQAQAEALVTLATAQELPLLAGYGTGSLGWALAMQGQGEAGVALLHQGMAAVQETGSLLGRPTDLLRLAEATGHAGHVAEGLRLVGEALTAFAASERGDMLSEAYRLQGEFLLRQAVPAAAQADACFQQALAIARRQQAKSWELRAAMSLSRLWQQQGKRGEASELLTPVYGWFTEGFDTADLQEAKALLETLAERDAGGMPFRA